MNKQLAQVVEGLEFAGLEEKRDVEQVERKHSGRTMFDKRPTCGGVDFTYDSLLQTLQVLFSLLVALVQESGRNSETKYKLLLFLCTSGQC